MKQFEKLFPWFLLAGILINANGLLNNILEPDGALYATIAKHIALTGNWSDLFGDGHDWLDKPHFPFWITALSFKLLGITAFAYKLPAFIFWLAGSWYTFKIARQLYNTDTARVAVIMYVFSLHGILNNFDVRAEPYLTTLLIAAIYYFYQAYTSGKWLPVVLAAFMAACAVITKGIFVLITFGSGFVIYWLLTKQWKQFINYRWWVMVVLILLFITPELYSLYTQFDLHPEKVVFGKTDVSGLRFFFWESQFGRFFNTGPIKGHGDPFFFLHTTLWAFLPWSVVLYVAVIRLFVKKEQTDLRNKQRWIIYGSAGVTFLLFSFSGFQLPYYIVILFPQFSIITAGYITSIQKETTLKQISILQTVLLLVAAVLVCALAFYSNFGNLAAVTIVTAVLVTAGLLFFKEPGVNRIIAHGAGVCLILFIFLHNFFYPRLLTYQSGMEAGKYINAHKLTGSPALFKSWSYTYEFYAPGFVETLKTYEDLDDFLEKKHGSIIYTSAKMLDELTTNGYQYNVVQRFPFYHISMLTGRFLNPATRAAELEQMVLITGVKRSR